MKFAASQVLLFDSRVYMYSWTKSNIGLKFKFVNSNKNVDSMEYICTVVHINLYSFFVLDEYPCIATGFYSDI